MNRDALLAPGEAELSVVVALTLTASSSTCRSSAISPRMTSICGGHLRRLGDDGGVDVADPIALGANQTDHVAQQRTAVGALEGRIGVGEVLADIARGAGTEQRIAEGMQ